MTSSSYENFVIAFFIFAFTLFVQYEKNQVVKDDFSPEPSSLCQASFECRKLAEVLVWEARGEPDVGKIAVANVVLNRVNHPKRWGSDIFSVVEENNQFSYLKDMHQQVKPSQKDWNIAKKIAYAVLNNQVYNPVGDALFYHSTKIKPPKWTKVMKVHSVIGGHVFYTCSVKC